MTFAEQFYLWFGLFCGICLGVLFGYAVWGYRSNPDSPEKP